MIARSHHHRQGRPICPYCGGTNVREIGEEGTDQHRHVCMDPRCPDISYKLMLKQRGLVAEDA